jgi:hypothetical protein
LRRAAAVAGGLGVVAIIAAATLLPSPPAPVPLPPPLPVTVPASGIAGAGQESVPAIAVTVCGQHYRVAGLAYRLEHPPRLTARYAGPPGRWS